MQHIYTKREIESIQSKRESKANAIYMLLAVAVLLFSMLDNSQMYF